MDEAGGDLSGAATVGGVISGVAAAGGDVTSAVLTSAAVVVEHATAVDCHNEFDVAVVGGKVLVKVIGEADRATSNQEEAMELVAAAAEATENAAYLVGRSTEIT